MASIKEPGPTHESLSSDVLCGLVYFHNRAKLRKFSANTTLEVLDELRAERDSWTTKNWSLDSVGLRSVGHGCTNATIQRQQVSIQTRG